MISAWGCAGFRTGSWACRRIEALMLSMASRVQYCWRPWLAIVSVPDLVADDAESDAPTKGPYLSTPPLTIV
jgi:hypothetical protein